LSLRGLRWHRLWRQHLWWLLRRLRLQLWRLHRLRPQRRGALCQFRGLQRRPMWSRRPRLLAAQSQDP